VSGLFSSRGLLNGILREFIAWYREESVRLDVYATFIGLLRMAEAACSTDSKSSNSIEYVNGGFNAL
jgi:hypothetical protein